MTQNTEAGCMGKDRLTRAQADAIVNRPRFKGHAYKCQSCGAFHVGHSNRMLQKQKAGRA